LPPSPLPTRRGAPRKKGTLIGSPQTLAQPPTGGVPHPSEAGAERQAWCGLGHTVLPGRLVQVVVLRRQGTPATKQQGRRKPPPAIAAFFTTDLTLSADELVRAYGHRWAGEILSRDRNAFAGLGQDQGRQRQRLVGAHTLRLVLAAARTLWFIAHVDQGTGVPLCRYRPWYRQTAAPSQLDIAEACREARHEASIFPIPRFIPKLADNDEEPEHALPRAA
jgi:hypothetical protein